MSNLALKRKWKRADELAMQSRTKALSDLSTLEGLYRTCVIEKQRIKEKDDRAVKLGNKMLEDKKFLALFEAGDARKLKQVIKSRISISKNPPEHEQFSIISQRSQYLVATGYTGYWGGFLSRFNRNLASIVPKPLALSEIQKMIKILKTEQSSASKNLSKLFSVIRKGNRDLMLDTSRDILQSQGFKTILYASRCASICAVTSSVLKGDIEGDPKRLGSLDLMAGKLVRSWILLLVCAFYVARVALLPDGATKFQQIVKIARGLPFRSNRKRAMVVSPKRLSSEGQSFDGRYVRVSGYVKNMTTGRTQDGKFLNLFEVYEPGAEEQAIKVAVIFEHMGHRGLVNTGYVELFGTWKETSPISDTPALQLERLKLTELARRFGFDFMLNSIRPWFDFHPNSYHAYWSIRPQIKTRGTGQGRLLTGAGEIIVIKPFLAGGLGD